MSKILISGCGISFSGIKPTWVKVLKLCGYDITDVSGPAISNQLITNQIIEKILVNKLRESIDEYDNIVIFSFKNMRTNRFKDVRAAFKESRFFMGKNKVMQVGLGRSEEEEYHEGLHVVANALSGQTGMLLTNKTVEECRDILESFKSKDFARAGSIATKTVKIEVLFLRLFGSLLFLLIPKFLHLHHSCILL